MWYPFFAHVLTPFLFLILQQKMKVGTSSVSTFILPAARGKILSAFLWSCWADSNCRPHPYQGCALPTELQQQSSCPPKGACLATEKGLEPSTSGVTGRRSNRLNHSATAQLVYQMNFDLSTPFFEQPGFFHASPAFLPFARAKTPQISSGSMAMAPMAEGPRMVWSA